MQEAAVAAAHALLEDSGVPELEAQVRGGGAAASLAVAALLYVLVQVCLGSVAQVLHSQPCALACVNPAWLLGAWLAWEPSAQCKLLLHQRGLLVRSPGCFGVGLTQNMAMHA
eukprot:396142-Pelagomonas_calceolata.AAC.1